VRLGDFIMLNFLRLSHSKHKGSFFLIHRQFVFVVTDYVELSVFSTSCTSTSKQKNHSSSSGSFSKSHSAMGFDVAFFEKNEQRSHPF
jgi:hypothetical protein